MSTKTTHVLPKNGKWAVTKEGTRKCSGRVYATQKEAIAAARALVQQSAAGQLVVHDSHGSFRTVESHGLPTLQSPPRRSKIGSKAIQKAVSAVLRKRLSGD